MTIGVPCPSPACADLLGQRDGRAVGGVEVVEGVAEPVRPIGAGAPGRGVDDEAHAALTSQGEVRGEVGAQLVAAGLVAQQGEGGEAGQVEPAVEDQRGLQTAVGEKRAGGGGVELREAMAITHGLTLPGAERPRLTRHASIYMHYACI